MELPLVSVPVITYNSAKTVIETLDSIKKQTYPYIELIIADDCSTDNTIDLCRKWIEQNIDRFARTEILTVEKNTGVAGNCNRAEAACLGEWVKPIAGDDLLMPNCIKDCLNYVADYPDTIYLFGKQKAFGVSKEICNEIDARFDYTFFSMTQEAQLHRLIFDWNCIPATTTFYHRKKLGAIGVKNDERIPLLEDWPKWINLLRSGIKFNFIDNVLVMYRVGGISTGNRPSLNMYRSQRLFDFFYRFPEWYKKDPDKAVCRFVDEECDVYQILLESNTDTEVSLRQERNHYKRQYEVYYKWYNQVSSSKAYCLGKFLLKPFSWIKKNI